MKVLDARHRAADGPSFTLGNRVVRVMWSLAWLLLARWTPPPFHAWRALVLRSFGARVGPGARIHAGVIVWLPSNLRIGARTLIGPGVRLYNQGAIDIGDDVVVSQGAHLCASSHDLADPYFQLVLRPVHVEAQAWIAADAFIGPGVTVGTGAVVGARAALFGDAEPWSVYSGNPAGFLKRRVMAAPTDR